VPIFRRSPPLELPGLGNLLSGTHAAYELGLLHALIGRAALADDDSIVMYSTLWAVGRGVPQPPADLMTQQAPLFYRGAYEDGVKGSQEPVHPAIRSALAHLEDQAQEAEKSRD
jgi:hypothetical protein